MTSVHDNLWAGCTCVRVMDWLLSKIRRVLAMESAWYDMMLRRFRSLGEHGACLPDSSSASQYVTFSFSVGKLIKDMCFNKYSVCTERHLQASVEFDLRHSAPLQGRFAHTVFGSKLQSHLTAIVATVGMVCLGAGDYNHLSL